MDTNVSHLNPVHEIYASVLRNALILGDFELSAINVKSGGGVRLNDNDTADYHLPKHIVVTIFSSKHILNSNVSKRWNKRSASRKKIACPRQWTKFPLKNLLRDISDKNCNLCGFSILQTVEVQLRARIVPFQKLLTLRWRYFPVRGNEAVARGEVPTKQVAFTANLADFPLYTQELSENIWRKRDHWPHLAFGKASVMLIFPYSIRRFNNAKLHVC
jgi:hypothetical protein